MNSGRPSIKTESPSFIPVAFSRAAVKNGPVEREVGKLEFSQVPFSTVLSQQSKNMKDSAWKSSGKEQ